MTGEVTLRGKVLPIGGVRDKVLGAHRAGIEMVILPKENRKDIEDLPEAVRKSMKLVFVDHVDQVIDRALIKLPRAPRAARQKSDGSNVSRAVSSVN